MDSSNEVFAGKLPSPPQYLVFIKMLQHHYMKLIYMLINIHNETFAVLLKSAKFSPANLPHLRYSLTLKLAYATIVVY